ncbi:hypothetical protein [Actinomadura sp. 9N407]|uniref:hypothetical protein n=1 Tax=Actinomadura sp. 9N407 TaxID=3375154 RepID=UPI003795FED6
MPPARAAGPSDGGSRRTARGDGGRGRRGRAPAKRDGGPGPQGPADMQDGGSGRGAARGRSAGRRDGTYQRKQGRSARIYFFLAGGLGLVIVVVLLAVLVMGGGEKPPAGKAAGAAMGPVAESGLSPSSYSSSASTGAYAKIEQRSADPAPLTAGEAFPDEKLAVPDAGAELSLKGKRLDGDCAAAVWGSGVGDELRRGSCTQAVRGVYADGDHALTVAVFNLAGKENADRLVGRLESGGGFVRPLPAGEPLDRFGQGFSMARGLAVGHYAVVAWAQRLDGKGDVQDEALLSLLIEGGKAPGPLGRAARAS